jgi:ribosomal protein S18 acetylase RimI-like enzyme
VNAQVLTDGAVESGTPGILIFGNANTTIGYCRYTPDGEVEYIFVHPQFRRRGHARHMLARVEAMTGRRLRFQPPISPLGGLLQRHYDGRQSD